MINRPSLSVLERLVAERSKAQALQMALAILRAIDDRSGALDGVLEYAALPHAIEEDTALDFARRFAMSFARLWGEPDLEISLGSYERLLGYHRWIALIFSQSGFRSADYFLSLLGTSAGNERLDFDAMSFLRLLPVLTLNSSVDIDFDQFWRANELATAVAFFNYLGSHCVFSRRAFECRERLLEWFPPRLAEIKLGMATLAQLPEVYMHCSYAFSSGKHAIKRTLMEQMRRACLEAGVVEPAIATPANHGSRPTIIVVGEQFAPWHPVFRSHSPAVQSLRTRFHVTGLVYPNPRGTPTEASFDDCIDNPTGDFRAVVCTLAAQIAERKPALILYLGVGMMPVVTALASLRLAPIQCASFGHAATTMSPSIDYFILPEDFVASRTCFSERVLALPKAAMPFARRPSPATTRHRTPDGDGVVRVAIPASVMKLNPMLFEALARVATRAKGKVAFHFLPVGAIGLTYFELSRAVRASIPGAVVHPQSPHEQYVDHLAQCDLFLCPFPYGNMNGIIDTFELGLPGVCLDGVEPHAHADAAFFARTGLPKELAAGSVDDYVAAALRLIDDEPWRRHCADIVRNANLDAAFFEGDSALFCSAIGDLIRPQAPAAAILS
jgi:hypothetical protein